MMSAFFYFLLILNRLFNAFIVILILDSFFFKYERGRREMAKLTSHALTPPPHSHTKNYLQKPSLVVVKLY